jgi:hypothetical protein
MKRSSQEEGWKMEVIDSEIKENEAILEIKYQKEGHYSTHSKEKIIFFQPNGEEKRVYLITFIVFDKDWSEFKEPAEEVFRTIQLVD